jgi:L-idonate 5-dehydrogenase
MSRWSIPLKFSKRNKARAAVGSAAKGDVQSGSDANRGDSVPSQKLASDGARFTIILKGARPVLIDTGAPGDERAILRVNTIVTKELQLRGTFRFDSEFELAYVRWAKA